MSRNALEASARSLSLSFSKAIEYELNPKNRKVEEVVPAAANFHDGTSDTISDAISWELERTFRNSAVAGFDGEDECKRFALTLSEDGFDDKEEFAVHLPASTTSHEEVALKPNPRSK